MISRSGRRRRRTRLDQGVTLIETAIVALLVLTFLLAIFEFGLLFRDNLTATDAVADATRIGAIMGPDVVAPPDDGVGNPTPVNADYAIVNAVRQGLSSLSGADVRYVVVFKGSGSGDDAAAQVPEACKRGISLQDICNAYPADAAFAAVEAGASEYFTCPDPPTAKIACRWDPAERSDGPTSAEIDSLGVYIRIRRDGYTGLFADSWTISRASIVRLEPGVMNE